MTIEAVLDAERRRGAALVERDIDTLRELLARELTHTHTRGVTDNLASFLHFVEHGAASWMFDCTVTSP